MKTGANIRLRSDGRFEARYEKGRTPDGKIVYGYCYAKTRSEAEEKKNKALATLSKQSHAKQMNLLILGAGGQGQVVKELAQDVRVFKKIAFLDDDPLNPHTMDTCDNCWKYLDEYPIAIPSVGNNALRQKWIGMLVQYGFILPTLIHSTATVSPSAEIGYGTVVEAKVTISANAKIGVGCIISSGAIIERNVTIQDWTHIECGRTVRKE
ncbi:hypothetical protein ACS3UN_08320 [Oscillospiraceae bacterium LTW-04]|nr:hypothetical protein RBH76_02030 [Oscillospiraceae bacterium MB24-C1]